MLSQDDFDRFFNAMVTSFNLPWHIKVHVDFDKYKLSWYQALRNENFDKQTLIETYKAFIKTAKEEGREKMPSVFKFISYKPKKEGKINEILQIQFKASEILSKRGILSTHDNYHELLKQEMERLGAFNGNVKKPIQKSLAVLPKEPPSNAPKLVRDIFENQQNRKKNDA